MDSKDKQPPLIWPVKWVTLEQLREMYPPLPPDQPWNQGVSEQVQLSQKEINRLARDQQEK